MKLPLLAAALAVGVCAASSEAQVSSTGTQPGQKPAPTLPSKRVTKALPPGYVPPSSSGSHSSFLVGGSDDCSTADPISGLSTFAVNTAGATDSTQQTGFCPVAHDDVWFNWTSTVSGTVIASLCGSTSADTVMAIYPGTACPSAGSQIGCNDDFCAGFGPSQVTFTATNGSHYLIQLGNYAPNVTYSATLSMTTPPPPTNNDDCSLPIAISGAGTFPINTAGATDSVQQTNFCPLAHNDVWMVWTATQTGNARVSMCGIGADTVIAAYAGSTCPASGSQLACDDDSAQCGLQSIIIFPVTNGNSYMLQFGAYGTGTTYSGTFAIDYPAPPVNDACTTPTNVVGNGPFGFDNQFATTGAQGQAEASCNFTGGTAIAKDVWFTWTATFTSVAAQVTTCTLTGVNTKIAVYNGSGCPSSGAIACNDDSCFTQAAATFASVQGQTYTIQLGLNATGTTGGTGSFRFRDATPPSNDDCSAPIAISGLGPFPFDTTSATTGSQGQTSGACLAYGTTGIDLDTWYTWVAPSSDQFALTLCSGTAGLDTKVGVYDGAGCPAGQAIACNDDSCGLVSQTCFIATQGQSYTFQIGAYPGAVGGPGSFSLVPSTPPAGCTIDDGSSENSVGWTAGGTFVWLNRFGTPTSTTTVTNILGCYGTPLYPGFVPPAGTAVTYAIWSNPANDGNAANTTLLAQVNTTTSAASIDSDVFQVVPLPSPVTVTGYFFVGIALTHSAGQYVGTLDQSSTNPCGGGLSWYCGVNSGTVNLTTLSANQYPPATIDSAGIPGIWLVRADCNGSTGTAYCFGDGTGLACPCTSGAAGNGCPNSVNAAGANLAATGAASVSADSVVLHGIGMPNSSALYFQGTTQIAVVFGDGLRCVGGAVVRLRIKSNVGGASQYPDVGDPSVSMAGLVPAAGGTRTYQIWYRNAAAYCTASTFNLSNGLSINWQP